MDSLVFWRSFNFVNQNKNPTSLKIQYLTIGVRTFLNASGTIGRGYKNQLSINNAAISKNNQKLLAS